MIIIITSAIYSESLLGFHLGDPSVFLTSPVHSSQQQVEGAVREHAHLF